MDNWLRSSKYLQLMWNYMPADRNPYHPSEEKDKYRYTEKAPKMVRHRGLYILELRTKYFKVIRS